MSDDAEALQRLRPFRGLAWGLYLFFAVGFSSLIIFSVFKSVLSMTPGAPEFPASPLTEVQCLDETRALFSELEARRKGLADASDVSRADQDFLTFRVAWLGRKRALEARCALDEREKVADALKALERVMDLYTTSSVQFAGGVGPATDELKALLQP
jgi:hypothetical protein